MPAIALEHLEMHVAHACNLSCESCSHYSNQRHGGLVDLDEAERWVDLWRPRLNPVRFHLLGGEPTLHPELPAFLKLVRRAWPDTQITLITNGWFLHRHPTLPQWMRDDHNASLRLSIHHDAPAYLEKLRPIISLLEDWDRRYGIDTYVTHSHKKWTRRYKGVGSAMQPFEDNDPRSSWEICPAKHTRQLFDDKLWKCAPLTYLRLQDAKYDLSEKWRPYLQYQPLEADCTDDALAEFLAREDEPVCAMCPAKRQPFKLPVPMPVHEQSAVLSESAASVGADGGQVNKKAAVSASPFILVSPRSSRGQLLAMTGPGMAPSTNARRPSRASTRALASGVYPLSLPLAEDPKGLRKSYHQFRGLAGGLDELACHASVLSPGKTPHPPHTHIEEEILIMLDGEADLLVVDHARQNGDRQETPPIREIRLRAGQFIYYPVGQHHTLRTPTQVDGADARPATYLMFKWRPGPRRHQPTLGATLVRDTAPLSLPGASSKRGMNKRRLLSGRTQHLRRLRSHRSIIRPGGGYAPHADDYSVCIVTRRGRVETLGQIVEPHSVVYYAPGDEHGMRQVGDEPAEYLVFEFRL